jgi:uncharacterized sulfatase
MSTAAEARGAGGTARPNFVFIMTDTQATNVLGAYGRQDMRTPRIDGLAAEGVTFDRAYTTCPLCTPARAALFTGRSAHAVGAWANNQPLGANVRHMGQRLRDAGYRTAYTGKWHLDGHDYFGTGECPDGWDDRYWYDGMRYQRDLSPQERRLWRGGLRAVADLRTHDIRPEFTWGHRVSDRATRFLREATGGGEPHKPFALVVSYDEPHGPFTCPPEYAEPFEGFRYPIGPAAFDDLAGKPRYQQEWAAAAPERRRRAAGPNSRRLDYTEHPLYFGCNSFVDSEIGRVIDAVDRYAPENTWIVYTSDHGDMLGAHGLHSKAAAVYEEIAHIPLIVRPPRAPAAAGPDSPDREWVAAGARVSGLVSHIDVLPTLLDLAGLTIPPVFEGESLVPLLRGESGDPERPVFVEFNRFAAQGDGQGGFTPMRAVIMGPHKLNLYLHDTDELYDLASDPAEVRNRIDDPGLAQVRDALHDTLLDWMYANRDPFRAPAWEQRPWRRSRRLTFTGGWTGRRRGRGDGYAPPFTQENPDVLGAGH